MIMILCHGTPRGECVMVCEVSDKSAPRFVEHVYFLLFRRYSLAASSRTRSVVRISESGSRGRFFASTDRAQLFSAVEERRYGLLRASQVSAARQERGGLVAFTTNDRPSLNPHGRRRRDAFAARWFRERRDRVPPRRPRMAHSAY